MVRQVAMGKLRYHSRRDYMRRALCRRERRGKGRSRCEKKGVIESEACIRRACAGCRAASLNRRDIHSIIRYPRWREDRLRANRPNAVGQFRLLRENRAVHRCNGPIVCAIDVPR